MIIGRVKNDRLIDDIEALRAFAVLFTMYEHLYVLLPWTSNNSASIRQYLDFSGGVDLFFCISGFVIIRSLSGSLWSGETDQCGSYLALAIPFWIRRAWRLLPSAYLAIILTLLATVFFNRAGIFGNFYGTLYAAISCVLEIVNFHLLFIEQGWIQTKAEYVALSPYWSLSLEEQFYLLLPLAVFLTRTRRGFIVMLLVCVVLQLFLLRPIWSLPWAIRSDGLLLGAAIALWQGSTNYRQAEPLFLRCKLAAIPALLVSLILMAAIPSSHGNQLVASGMLTITCAFLVFAASYNKNYIFPDNGAKKCLLWIGSRSYAIYLIHVQSYIATRELWFRWKPEGTVFDKHYFWEFLITAAVLIGIFAEISFRLIETPLRTRGRRIASAYLERKSKKAATASMLASKSS
jgi:peptidoglycan/LPS O-acetylase OafA/YrhL